MGLRLREGIDPDAIAKRFGLAQLLDSAAVSRLVQDGLLEWDDRQLRTTASGRLLLDSVLGWIADPQLPSSSLSEKLVT